jgi:diaminohydroxyphosphoribosylaminopyrimidine deaminase / 5-amino-6-(5-phosphoribosylamino)uracil reductase
MRRALDLAADPAAPLGPNPRVGCVILDPGGSIIAEGFHRGAGTAHAEVVALAAAGGRAVGATAVVTLEPCKHSGRTPPCTGRLIEAGVRRVVFAQADTSPVAAGGAAVLLRAGVDVQPGVLAEQAAALNPRWTFAVAHHRPFVTWKFAASLDGRSAASDGTSRWITGAAARQDVHRLRAEADVVLVGAGTALADDPALTVRDDCDRPRTEQPLRAVMGLRELPATLRLWDSTAESVQLRTRDPAVALATLYSGQRQHVWLEGGPRLAAAFVRSGLVDRVVAYIAPVLLGSGAPALADAGVTTIGDALRLDIDDATELGGDLRVIAHLTGAARYAPASHPPTNHAPTKD